ncbi:hypothetical protein PVAG01_05409 [Phlyctema vagabunda]|uniref:SWI5-dependent HO expression protein 3 n=1 Tax=Phlyctema vagabunda TaxID=108571 RepID=A0ABR4PJZ6_9HELO
MLGKITQINQLADSLFENRPLAEYSQRNGLLDGPRMQDALDGEVKRRYSAETDRGPRAFDCVAPTHSHSRTRSPVPRRASNDDYSIVKSKPLYCAGAQSTMNPPPAPGRQLPSSPGRQLPSPTSVSFPSPSAVSYSSNISPNTTPLTSSQQSTSSTNLPSLAVGLSGDSAIQAHSAALQHEVSIQKIALSSLQGEHDKLLAAFSRSQTRSSALEKKHAVSDGEIINLTEEKLRLQQQVVELERDVEDLTRSRDEFRQAAVQESAQYIEIVKKATHLEQMTGEERKAWKVLKREFEQKIDFLESRRADELRATGVTLKIEGSSSDAVVAVPPSGDHSELLQEVRRLRSRCTKAEDALRAVRADAERLVGSLNIAGRSIMEQVDSSLVLEASAIPGDNGRG